MDTSLTPQAVFSLYRQLNREQQHEFLELVGKFGTAVAPIAVCAGMTESNQVDFANIAYSVMSEKCLMLAVRQAIPIAREFSHLTDEELANETEATIRDWILKTAEAGKELYKKERDRGVDDERLERGRVIRDAKADGITWKKMPAHILTNHPEWFPEFEGKILDADEKKKLQERLRKMARDSKKL